MLLTKEQLETFLAAQAGFELEMKTANRLRAWSFGVEQTGTYNDLRQQKIREFDIRATGINGNLTVLLGVECTTMSPGILVYGTRRHPQEAGHQLLLRNFQKAPINERHIVKPMVELSGHAIADVDAKFSVYLAGELVGRHRDILKYDKNGSALNRSGDKDFFDKISQALASTEAMLVYHLNVASQEGRALAAVPFVIVPDDCLYVAEYADDGTRIKVGAAQFISQLVQHQFKVHPFSTFTISHVEICTYSGLLPRLKQLLHPDFGQGNTPLFMGVGYHDGRWLPDQATY